MSTRAALLMTTQNRLVRWPARDFRHVGHVVSRRAKGADDGSIAALIGQKPHGENVLRLRSLEGDSLLASHHVGGKSRQRAGTRVRCQAVTCS